MTPKLSIIIVNYNTRAFLEKCLNSVFEKTCYPSFEVIVVDNASEDDSLEMVESRFPQVRLIKNAGNVGFGVANNIGVAASSGHYLMLFNSDAVLMEDSASALIAFLKNHPKAGVVGPAVCLSDGRPQPKIFGNLPTLRTIFNESLFLDRLLPRLECCEGIHMDGTEQAVLDTGWISGVCMMFRREAYCQVNGFDPQFFLYAEDLDLCYRLKKAGWAVFHLNAAAIKHFCGGSSPQEVDRSRNNLMQQQNLMLLLSRNLKPSEFLLAKFFLIFGLFLRLAITFLTMLAGNFSCAAQLKAYSKKIFDLCGLKIKRNGGQS